MKDTKSIAEETVVTVKVDAGIAFSIEDIKKHRPIITELARIETGKKMFIEDILNEVLERIEREFLSQFLGWDIEDSQIVNVINSYDGQQPKIDHEKMLEGLLELADKYPDFIAIEEEEITIYEDDIDMDASKYHGVGWVEKLGKWIALKPGEEPILKEEA